MLMDHYLNSILKCVKDCVPGSQLDLNGDCGGIADPWAHLFLTAKDCCSTKLPWLDANECMVKTPGGTFFTYKFYVGESESPEIYNPI